MQCYMYHIYTKYYYNNPTMYYKDGPCYTTS